MTRKMNSSLISALSYPTSEISRVRTREVKEGRMDTDPDVVERSNLSRQFLFREKHVREYKSVVAAASVVKMNPTLRHKIVARTDKVSEDNTYLFSNHFFGQLTVVTNALDNVTARRYIDSRCVANYTPLLESGTLGPKGHVQVIIPHKTESYSSQNDPEDTDDTQDIPVCTLKMLPEEPIHCIEWARDKFTKLFTQQPRDVLQLVTESKTPPTTPHEVAMLRRGLRLLNKRPRKFEDCVLKSRGKFDKYFGRDIEQLLSVYPPDAKTKEGVAFWTSPRRPPHPLRFIPQNPLCVEFVVSLACLYARVWNVAIPPDIGSEQGRQYNAKLAATSQITAFQLSAEKRRTIIAEVEQMSVVQSPDILAYDTLSQTHIGGLLDTLKATRKDLASEGLKITAEEFDCDDDTNFHIDFIHAMANCRAECYNIESLSWIDTKLKAGRIVPAIASTTAVIAALQTLELIKLVKGVSVSTHRNAFVNLALPYLSLSEPGPPKVTELRPGLRVTIWDRWEVRPKNGGKCCFGDFLNLLKETYQLEPRDCFRNTRPIYLHAPISSKVREAEIQKIP